MSYTLTVLVILVVTVGVGYTLLTYFRNKQNDRFRHRRERLEEKKEELMDTIRKKNDTGEKHS